MKLLLTTLLFCPLFLWSQIRESYLTDPPKKGNEPSISMNPSDPDDIWIAYNNNSVYHSLTRGKVWLPIDVKPIQGFYGDPVIYKSQNGSIYLAHLAQNPDKQYPNSFDCIVFERSTNGVSFYSKGIGANGKMQDKPWFTVDEWKESPYRNNIYLSWTEFDAYGSKESKDSSRIRFSYSEDLGATFSTPVVISDRAGSAVDDSRTAEGATIGVFQDGSLICVWSRNDTLWYDVSRDAGRNWGKDKMLAATPGGWSDNDTKGMMRANGMPFVCSDTKGRAYVVYTAKSTQGDWDVFYTVANSSTSDFSKPMKVNDDNGNSDQYFPYAVMDRNLGVPRVIWYDLRNSQTGRFAQIFTAELKPSGSSKNINLSPEPLALIGKSGFYGDYIGFTSAKGGGGMAAVTTYDYQTNETVIQLLNWKQKRPKPNKPAPVIVINPVHGSDSLLFLVNMPGETSFTFEIKGGPKIFSQQVYTSNSEKGFEAEEFQEIWIPKNRLPSGVYQVMIRRNKKAVRKRFWVE